MSDPLPGPPEGKSQDYRDGWADGMAGGPPDPERCTDDDPGLNDYERGYIASGLAEGEARRHG